jgi:cell division protein FtsL
MRKQIAFLAVAVMVVALAVVELRHRNRLLFAELQTLTRDRDRLNVEWGQLLLEQGAWSEHRRIEETARLRLGMAQPASEQVVIVRTTRESP